MADLVYGVHRQLRDGEQVVAGFRDEAPHGCLLVEPREYEIARDRRIGWHFHLIDRETGDRVSEYEPRRLLPGGRISGRRARLTLRTIALRRYRWTITSESGWRLRAKVSDWTSEAVGTPGPRSYHTVELHGPRPVTSHEDYVQLAFCCWLLTELTEAYEHSGFGAR